MNVYKISQNTCTGYDTFDSVVVYAENEEEAAKICPSKYYQWDDKVDAFIWDADGDDRNETDVVGNWCQHWKQVNVVLIGKTNEKVTKGVIIASFNAG